MSTHKNYDAYRKLDTNKPLLGTSAPYRYQPCQSPNHNNQDDIVFQRLKSERWRIYCADCYYQMKLEQFEKCIIDDD